MNMEDEDISNNCETIRDMSCGEWIKKAHLGVTFDQEVSMETTHVKNICHSAMAHLGDIIDISTSLKQCATKKVVHALVTSRIENGYALLYGIPASPVN